MRLIFLHGPPAVGKLTVALVLAELIPARLSDNHASIDLARTVIDFGAPGFWDLVHKLRLNLLEAAATSDTTYFITTACYHSGDEPIIADWEEILQKHGATLLPVHLVCDANAQVDRVVQADRGVRGKLNSVDGLESYMAKNDYVPIPRENCLTIDTTALQPQEVAQQIISHFNLQQKART